MSAKKTIPVGARFASLVVISTADVKSQKSRSLCRCDCGKESIVYNRSLITGNTGSCGCMSSRTNQHYVKHGLSHSKIWNCWNGMMQRCFNPKTPSFKNYGGRGITVCKRWITFENFADDMGNPPQDLTLERVNNDLGYSPDNCKWGTRKEQSRNQRPRLLGKHHLKESDVREIKARYTSSSVTQMKLAQDFSVSPACINQILTGKRWRHVA